MTLKDRHDEAPEEFARAVARVTENRVDADRFLVAAKRRYAEYCIELATLMLAAPEKP